MAVHDDPVLPLARTPSPPKSIGGGWGSLRRRRRPLLLLLVLVVVWWNWRVLVTIKRDLGYVLRPLWDRPPDKWNLVTHFPRPVGDDKMEVRRRWCGLHGWEARTEPQRPLVVDAIPVASELDMLELRMREYAPYVKLYLFSESNGTHSGDPKPLYYADNRERFERIAAETGAEIVYHLFSDTKVLPPGSHDNEFYHRRGISELLNRMREDGTIPKDSLVLMTDLDEIVSRDTLDLLTSCHPPQGLHLNMRNYMYSYNHPLRDDGNWVPHVHVVDGEIPYHHRRDSDTMLVDSGWHCSFCFPTLEAMRFKMTTYGHNDRVTPGNLDEKTLRHRVCTGQDPFGMWPEVFKFRELIMYSGALRPEDSFLNVPIGLQENPDRFRYLLDHGCERPNK